MKGGALVIKIRFYPARDAEEKKTKVVAGIWKQKTYR